MRVEPDYEELLALFNRHNVRYCIIGSFALAFHARPRYTKDIDIVIDPTTANARRVIKALKDFGFASLDISTKDLTKMGQIIQLGYEPVRVDLLTSLEGLSFSYLWSHRTSGMLGAQEVWFMGREDLVSSKERAGRTQDRADLEVLENSHRRKPRVRRRK